MRRLMQAVGYKIVQMSRWGLQPEDAIDLTGDRDVEWAWVAANMPAHPGRVLDLGPATSFTPLIGAMTGAEVIGYDRDPPPVPFAAATLAYRKGDILLDGLPEGSFDIIVNCSTTEHIGLSGRYGSSEDADGDLTAMRNMHAALSGPDARMIFTIPVGRDSVQRPFHRIYGEARLPKVLDGYRIVRQQFYAKTDRSNAWLPVTREVALRVEGSPRFYALGLFVLAPA